MKIADLSRNGVLYHYRHIALATPNTMSESLSELSPNKLKKIAADFEIQIAGDKAETIKTLVKAIRKIDMANQKEEPMDTEEKSFAETNPTEDDPQTDVAIKERGEIGTEIDLAINPVWKKMIPRSSKEDYTRTKASIEYAFSHGGTLSETIKARMLSDGSLEVYDGHTRIQILEELKIPITEDLVEIVELTDDQVAREIFSLNVTRRHLMDAEKIRLAKKFLPEIKAAHAEAVEDKKETAKKAKEAAKKAEKAAMSARIKKSNADNKKKVEEAKKAKREAKEAEKKAKEAAKTAKEKETRQATATIAGVSSTQVALYNWLEKFAPVYLEQETKKGIEIGTIYAVAHDEWFKTIKKFSSELWDSVKTGKKGIEDAYKEAAANKPKDVHAPGPLERCVEGVKELYLKILAKKYGAELDGKIDEYEADYINGLDTRIGKFKKSNM